MGWKPEYEENRKQREAENPELREKRLASAKASQERNREARKEYMREYYKNNRDKWPKRSPEKQAQYNATRRAKYAEDQAFREELKAKSLEWQRSNPHKKKNQRLVATFGIELSDFRDMLEMQKGGCAICGYSDMSNPKFFPVVDHCHTTGKVRGLLCMNCNNALGKFKDDMNILWCAIAYLQRNG